MSKKFNSAEVINGTFGKVWVNNELVANTKSFEAKISIDYEDINVSNNLATQSKMTGYSITGTMTLHKVDSQFIKLYANGLKTGDLPSAKVIAALDDPASKGTERVELTDVYFDEIQLSKFENKTITEEEVPFRAGGHRILQTI